MRKRENRRDNRQGLLARLDRLVKETTVPEPQPLRAKKPYGTNSTGWTESAVSAKCAQTRPRLRAATGG